jgi:hypothetical protein
MPVPDFQSLMLPILEELSANVETNTAALRERIRQRFALNDEDVTQLLPSGRQQVFVNRVAWALSYLKQVGIVANVSRGTYQVTARGRDVLAERPDRIDIAFLRRYPELSAFVDGKEQGAEPESSADHSPVVAAAAQWRDRCLQDDGSVLSLHRLWNVENLAALQRFYLEAPDESDRKFAEKLQDQLKECGPAVKQLAAEMLWVLCLFPVAASMKPDTKRELIRTIWSWSGEMLQASESMLGAPLDAGIGRPGVAFATRRWAELAYLIRVTQKVKSLSGADRKILLSDPWATAAMLDGVAGDAKPQMRHVLRYLLFPDVFEASATGRDKRDIVAAFLALSRKEIRQMNAVEIDRAILRIRREEESKRGATGRLSFYQTPLKEVWRPEGADPADAPAVRYWKISPGADAQLWPQSLRDGYISIGWNELGDLSDCDRAEFDRRVDAQLELHGDWTRDGVEQVWRFLNIQEGDRIVANRGTAEVLGIGTVVGEYFFVAGGTHSHRLPVRWDDQRARQVSEYGWRRTLIEITGEKFNRILGANVDVVTEDVSTPGETSVEARRSNEPYDLDAALKELFIGRSQFEAILRTFRQKQNLIVQGPPGVGKTYFARRLAYCLLGEKDTSRVGMIQFHQAFSYEDFVQGYRPTGSGFVLRDGVFFDFASKAHRDPGRDYVFIVDEVNRANLGKVFGELMMLIERDKRSSEWAVPLAYAAPGSEPYFVPPNLYLLGLMNTADRSLAMVDYALRRRFAFVDLRPGFETAEFSGFLASRGADAGLIRRIIERMGQLNTEITNDRVNLGSGFCIGHSFFSSLTDGVRPDVDWYRQVIEGEVAPLLREYWFDKPGVAADWIDRLLA